MRQIEQVAVESVMLGERLRLLNSENLARIKSSMSEIGLQNPIICRLVNDYVDGDGEVWENAIFLVSGLHRLEGARALGWEKIDAIVIDSDDIDAGLAEIDENLCRAELTEAEEADHLKRRKELWEARAQKIQVEKVLPPEIGYKKPPIQTKGFAAETAAVTGQSKQTINNKIARAEAIAPDVLKTIQGSKHDKGVVLDILKKLTHAEQRQALFRVKSGASPSFQDAYEFIKGDVPAPKVVTTKTVVNDDDSVTTQVNSLIAAWNRAGPEARQRFRDHIDEPVFENTRAGAR